MNLKTHRLVRQLHLWIGAWGAIAAILFGISGFMQNHRGIMKLPQGDTTEISSVELEVPEAARESREAMLSWLRDIQHLDVASQRQPGRGEGADGGRRGGQGSRAGGRGADGSGAGEGAGRRPGGEGADGGRRGGEAGPSGGAGGPDGSGPKRWMFNGGNARILTQVEYTEGASTATVRKSENSPLAILSRLHKGVGGGIPWILLTDSFAVAMVLLGISGIILWVRGRSVAQMAFSIVGVAVVVLLVIGGSALV